MNRGSSLRLTLWPIPRTAGWVAMLAHLHWDRRRRRGRFSRAYLPARILNGLDDIDISGAAAEVSRDSSPYLLLGRLVIMLQQRDSGHHHARCAEATLQAVLLHKALLYG